MGRSHPGARRTAAAAATLALLVGIPATAGAQSAPEGGSGSGGSGGRCTPGAPGVGDEYYPTYGNGGYDVEHYDLDLTYDPATDQLDGTAWLDVTATQNLCSFNLDLVGMEVRSVEVNGRSAEWRRDGQELIITPRRPLRDGRQFEVTVEYDGVPVEFTLPGFGIPTGWMTTDDGAIVAGQPEAATAWFPVNDHPLDKASYSFEVRVPQGYEVVANGHPRGRPRTSRGWTTWRWEASEPMASYLATIDIGYWDVDRWRTASGLPVYDAVDSAITGGLREVIDASLARQGEIVDFLAEAFGPYPFSTIGAIVDSHPEFRFALETQTRPVYSTVFWGTPENPRPADWVVVHEIAHQWFGDDVALARWQDIWLNEGFATYAEWLWAERETGIPVNEQFLAFYDLYPADDPFWSVVIGDPGIDDLFHSAVYERGGMTLQALRNEVGDEAFWEIVRTWAAENSGGHGTTPEFIALAEEISGQQLDALFDAWLFTGARPPLDAAAAGQTQAAAVAGTVSDEARAQVAAWHADLARRLAVGPH